MENCPDWTEVATVFATAFTIAVCVWAIAWMFASGVEIKFEREP